MGTQATGAIPVIASGSGCNECETELNLWNILYLFIQLRENIRNLCTVYDQIWKDIESI